MAKIEYRQPGEQIGHPAFGRVEDALGADDLALIEAVQRSENRRRQRQILVRVGDEELADAEVRRDRLNAWLGESGASKMAKITLQDMARHGMLSQPLVVVEASPAYSAAFVGMKADMSRIGNLFKAWVECGPGRWLGKGSAQKCPQCGQPRGLLHVGREASPEDAAEGRKLMKLITDTLLEWSARWPLAR